jgi:hypothetical protein
MFREILTVLYMFYSIIYVSGNFPEIFEKFPESFITTSERAVHSSVIPFGEKTHYFCNFTGA